MESSNSLEIQKLAEQVIAAVKTTLEPTVSYEQRYLAFEFLEKTKDDPNLAIPCGFFLSSCDKDPEVRHLGLQFLEDTIRYHWNDISLEKRAFIKENSMVLLASGTQDILVEPPYVKDKISRLVVELIKREWPQEWPNLLEELELLAKSGPTQAELVLLIFRRIAEDVATLQILESSSRRRDLYQVLNRNMDSIFCFFFNLLEEHYTKYKENPSESDNLKHCKITQIVFSTLSCYVEWVSIHDIQKHQSKFFTSMCHLISDQNIRQSAVECLLQIVSRKGKLEDRKFMLSLFDEDVMGSIFHAANLAVMDPLNEKNYLFLKGLTQVVTTLGSQLCCLWGKEHNVKEPQCFSIYLNSLLAFSKHPSLTIYSYTIVLWTQLFRNETIQKTNTLINIVPEWLPVAYSKILKHGFPSKSDSPTCQYTILDFDSDDEYYGFFCKVRSDSCEAIKLATFILPELHFTFAEERLSDCLQMELNPESLQNLLVSWGGVAHILERVMSQVMLRKKVFQVPEERALRLLRNCFEYKTSHPDILSYLLTCISGLCVMLPLFPGEVEKVLNKLFECISFTGDLSKDNRTKAVKNTRKHAASLLLKLCKTFPQMFSGFFKRIHVQIVELIQTNELSQLESVTLIQSLLILNSHINNYQGQVEYIGEVTATMKEDWLSLKGALFSPSSLMKFIGLNEAPSISYETDLFGPNRSKIFCCIDLILGLLNRCRWPADTKAAEEGGFVLGQSDGGFACRNPATPHVLALLPNIFCLFRAYNGLFLPESLAQLHPDYAKVHHVPEEEKFALLGMKGPSHSQEVELPKTHFQRMQTFLRNIQEHLCLILGYCGPYLGLEFYEYPRLAECLVLSVFWNFGLLSNLKMRLVVRSLKPFIEACPRKYHEGVLLPLIYHVAPIMMSELQSRWDEAARAQAANDGQDEDNVDTDQLVDNVMLHALTRDYLEVISAILTEKSGPPVAVPEPGDVNGNANDEMETSEDVKPQSLLPESVSQLGKLALRCDAICQAVVLTLLRSLSWPDSASCRRAVQPLFLCVQEMAEECQQHLNEDAVRKIFMCVLSSIHLHGQHLAELELLCDLSVSLYEKLRPHFPVLQVVLLGLPEVDAKDVFDFEEVLRKFADNSTKKIAKQAKFKRDSFKKVVRNIIGKSVGEALKKDAQFSDLKPIFRQQRFKPPILDETNEDLSLCSLFGTPVAE